MTNRWTEPEHALAYLERADHMPWRVEGMRRLADHLPAEATRILDLGTGDGRTLALALSVAPAAEGLGLDFNEAMLEQARARFAEAPRVEVRRHDLAEPLPDLGAFDLVVSSFAIHHLDDARKRELYREVFDALAAGRPFLHLEHVASATPELHAGFLDAMGIAPEDDDPSNRLVAVETQLGWLRDIGFEQVDCHWKWRELALFGGVRPGQ